MSEKLTLFTRLAQIGTALFTRRHGELVGTDALGNRYYRDRRGKTPRSFAASMYKEGRWVIYKGEPEATKVPPEWHGWLHHQTKDVPAADNPLRRTWQVPHQINPTGTEEAYRPQGHTLKGEHRARATGDYEAWTPE